MDSPAKPLILCVDDDEVTLSLIEQLLAINGYRTITAESGSQALLTLQNTKPDLILLDVMMPEVDGYEVCSRLQESKDLAYIPVIFVTALGEEQDRARAFAVGGVDYLVKPIQKDLLLHKVRSHLKTNTRWQELRQGAAPRGPGILPSDFLHFKGFVAEQLHLPPDKQEKLLATAPSEIYSLSSGLGLPHNQMAKYMAEFLNLLYLPLLKPEDVQLGVLPTPFCRTNLVVAISEGSARQAFALSNPFNWELLNLLNKFAGLAQSSQLLITEPENILALFKQSSP
jgi:CheY-like chemotaxis protein